MEFYLYFSREVVADEKAEWLIDEKGLGES